MSQSNVRFCLEYWKSIAWHTTTNDQIYRLKIGMFFFLKMSLKCELQKVCCDRNGQCTERDNSMWNHSIYFSDDRIFVQFQSNVGAFNRIHKTTHKNGLLLFVGNFLSLYVASNQTPLYVLLNGSNVCICLFNTQRMQRAV